MHIRWKVLMDNNFTHFHIYPARWISLLLIPDILPHKFFPINYNIASGLIPPFTYICIYRIWDPCNVLWGHFHRLEVTNLQPVKHCHWHNWPKSKSMFCQSGVLNHFSQLYKLRGAIQLFYSDFWVCAWMTRFQLSFRTCVVLYLSNDHSGQESPRESLLAATLSQNFPSFNQTFTFNGIMKLWDL